MTNSAPGQRLFTVSIEGVPMVLDQMGLANEVVAQFTLGESQEALVVATPSRLPGSASYSTFDPSSQSAMDCTPTGRESGTP